MTSGAVQCNGMVTVSCPGVDHVAVSQCSVNCGVSGTHRLEEINTKDAGHPVVVDDLNLVAVDALLPWYPESEFSVTEVLTK